MRKLSFVLITAAGLALAAGVAAPALAQVSIQFGTPSYSYQPYSYQPYSYQPNYGYTRQHYGPTYRQYPDRGYTTYSSPSYNYYGYPNQGYTTYSSPSYNYYGYPNQGYTTYSSPSYNYYGRYPNQGYTTYSTPYSYRSSDQYNRHYYHGYNGR